MSDYTARNIDQAELNRLRAKIEWLQAQLTTAATFANVNGEEAQKEIERLQTKLAEAAAFLDELAYQLDGDDDALAADCREMAEKLRK